jgi:DNA polymerase
VLQRPDLPEPVREVLQLRLDYGRAAAAKIPTAAGAVGADGRIRDCLAYHAAHTGRAGGRILQPQNLPRRSYDAAHWDAVLADLKTLPAVAFREKHNVSPVTAITWLLRGAIVARPGYTLVGGDLDKIELCVGAWTVRQENLLADLRAGVDTYRKLAAQIYGIPIDLIAADSVERQVGKSGMLGCTFGLGPDTFREFVRNNTEGRVTIDRATAVATIGAFRETYPRFPLAWREIAATAITAVRCPGTVQPCLTGRVHWRCTGDRHWLLCTLPSGRRVRYFRPHLVLDDGPFGPHETLRTWGVSKFTHQWGAERRWGSLLFENIVQAIARDLLMLAALKVTEAGFDIVLHVHDELLVEAPTSTLTPGQLNAIMSDAPAWAAGLPVATECWEGPRYG